MTYSWLFFLSPWEYKQLKMKCHKQNWMKMEEVWDFITLDFTQENLSFSKVHTSFQISTGVNDLFICPLLNYFCYKILVNHHILELMHSSHEFIEQLVSEKSWFDKGYCFLVNGSKYEKLVQNGRFLTFFQDCDICEKILD